jgi:hypothetical protein
MKHRTGANGVLAALKLTGAAALALPFILMTVLAGCPAEPDPDPAPPPPFTAVTGISGVPVQAEVNTELTLTGTVVPSNATNQTINWAVKNGTATINGDKLTATAVGAVTVTATIVNGKGDAGDFTKDFPLQVYAAGQLPTVSYVTISPATATVAKGGTKNFTATVTGNNSPSQSVTWSITTSGIDSGTTISDAGLLTVAVGEANTSLAIKAVSNADNTTYGTANVTVSSDPLLDLADVTIKVDTANVTIAYTGETLSAAYSGSSPNSYSRNYQWNKDGVPIPGSNAKSIYYTPAETGSYTVTLSSNGYQDKTSAAVTVQPAMSWTAVSSSPFGTNLINKIVYAGGKFVAVGYGGKIAHSTDGVTWTAVSSSTFATNISFDKIVYGGGKFVAKGYSGSEHIDKIAYSTDGETWAVAGNSTFGTNVNIRIAYGGPAGQERFVAGGGINSLAYSTDGISWTANPSANNPRPGAASGGITGIAYGGGIWVVGASWSTGVGDSHINYVEYSGDLTGWTDTDFGNKTPSSFYYDDINDITYTGGKFFVLGSKGKVVSSTNGIDWTRWPTSSPSPIGNSRVNDMAYGGAAGFEKFVVVMQGGVGAKYICYSTDGARWCSWSSSPNTNNFYGIAYGGGKWVAVGENGTIYYSNAQ